MNQPTTTGTATSRARQVRRAVRRQTRARLALSGPSGAGKTWTALSIAQVIAPGKPIVVIDTEPGDGSQGAAELYADQFVFDTIQWEPPYDPRDLTATIKELGQEYPEGVGIIDSASHFWRGEGGTLDLADGRFGGWKQATPAQDKMVEAILRSSMHWIVCTRAKQAYEVNDVVVNGQKKQSVQKLGLAPIQRDDLEYEFQVVAMIDTDHRIDIGKTRAAPLAGLSFPANEQERMANIYADWLAGGAELPRQVELDALLAAIVLVPENKRPALKTGLREQFGPMTALTVDQMPAVWNAVRATLGLEPHRFVAAEDAEALCAGCRVPLVAGWHDESAEPMKPAQVDPPATSSAAEPEQGDGLPDEPEFHDGNPEDDQPPAEGDQAPPAEDLNEYEAQVRGWVEALEAAELTTELQNASKSAGGSKKQRQDRLVKHLMTQAGTDADAS